MSHDAVANRHWLRLYSDFPEFQVAVCHGEEVAAAGNAIPVSWSGRDLPEGGSDAALEQGVWDHEEGRFPVLISSLRRLPARGAGD